MNLGVRVSFLVLKASIFLTLFLIFSSTSLRAKGFAGSLSLRPYTQLAVLPAADVTCYVSARDYDALDGLFKVPRKYSDLKPEILDLVRGLLACKVDAIKTLQKEASYFVKKTVKFRCEDVNRSFLLDLVFTKTKQNSLKILAAVYGIEPKQPLFIQNLLGCLLVRKSLWASVKPFFAGAGLVGGLAGAYAAFFGKQCSLSPAKSRSFGGVEQAYSSGLGGQKKDCASGASCDDCLDEQGAAVSRGTQTEADDSLSVEVNPGGLFEKLKKIPYRRATEIFDRTKLWHFRVSPHGCDVADDVKSIAKAIKNLDREKRVVISTYSSTEDIVVDGVNPFHQLTRKDTLLIKIAGREAGAKLLLSPNFWGQFIKRKEVPGTFWGTNTCWMAECSCRHVVIVPLSAVFEIAKKRICSRRPNSYSSPDSFYYFPELGGLVEVGGFEMVLIDDIPFEEDIHPQDPGYFDVFSLDFERGRLSKGLLLREFAQTFMRGPHERPIFLLRPNNPSGGFFYYQSWMRAQFYETAEAQSLGDCFLLMYPRGANAQRFRYERRRY
jgi:hypothetical protein